MKDFIIYAWDLCYASVCSSLSPEETKQRLNQEIPTGIQSQWDFAQEPFKDGTPNPCPCNKAPDTHRHYLFVC